MNTIDAPRRAATQEELHQGTYPDGYPVPEWLKHPTAKDVAALERTVGREQAAALIRAHATGLKLAKDCLCLVNERGEPVVRCSAHLNAAEHAQGRAQRQALQVLTW